MIKRIILLFCICALVFCLFACEADNGENTTTTQDTSALTTQTATTTKPDLSTTTTTIPRPTVTESPVSMPDENTAWANYIVDNEYNYIADRLTSTQKKNVKNMCAAVGCKVSFQDGYTKVTDAEKNVVYYSKSFGDETVIAEPQFGVLALAKRSDNVTAFVYKGATIFDFISYIKVVEVNGFYYSSVSSTDYMKKEGIFVGSDADRNSVIIKFTNNMVVIAVTYGV